LILREVGVLPMKNKKYENKYIPKGYKYGSMNPCWSSGAFCENVLK